MTRQFAADAKLLGWKLLSLRLWDSRGILYKGRHNICNRNCIFYCAKPLTPPSMCICRAHTSCDFFASFEGGGSFICRSYLVFKRGFRWRVKFHDFLFCAVPGELTNKPNKLLTSAFSPSSCRPSEKYLNLVVTYFTFVLTKCKDCIRLFSSLSPYWIVQGLSSVCYVHARTATNWDIWEIRAEYIPRTSASFFDLTTHFGLLQFHINVI